VHGEVGLAPAVTDSGEDLPAAFGMLNGLRVPV
jgi:hypothetical protein